jgi:hypothetical protein
MVERYIVRDKDGNYQSAYNVALGKEKAYSWALQCAKDVCGIIYAGDEYGEETKVTTIVEANNKKP